MDRFKTHVLPLIQDQLIELGAGHLPLSRMLTASREADQGDLSLPCFGFAKVLGQSPAAIADSLAEAIPPHEAVASVRAVNGYLNFTAAADWMAASLLQQSQEQFTTDQPRTVLIEHTSANPNGPFHVGRARNAILGDTLVRLNRLWGNNVTAEYYVDDMGKQVAVLAWALAELTPERVEAILEEREPVNPQWAHKADHQRVRFYQAAQILRQDEEVKNSIEEAIGSLVHASEHGDENVLDAFQAAYQPVLDGMLETLARLGIHFERFTKESTFVTNGDVAELMETLQGLEIHGEAENGAHFLDLGARGLKGKTEFFYRRGDGSSLYATRDIAYHRWKWQQSNALVNVLGEDHKLQAKQVGLTLEELNERRPEVVFYSFIKLPEGKMSTRRGNVVFMDDLLEEAQAQAATVVRELRPEYQEEDVARIAEAVGTSAVRFNIIKVSPEKGFTFRWEDALTFEAGSAPFAMYSHTRACSISAKVANIGRPQQPITVPSSEKIPEGMRSLLRALCTQRDVLAKAVEEHRPHLFAEHLLQLANAYNAFYRDCPIVDGDTVNEFYFAVSELARERLQLGLTGLGLEPLQHM